MKTPSQTPDMALAQCLAITGGNRGSNSATLITSINRGIFKKWLVANGVASTVASDMPLATLREIWSDTSDVTLGMWQASPVLDDKPAADKTHKGTVDAAIQALIEATKGGLDEAKVIALIHKHATKTVRTEIFSGNRHVSTLDAEPHHSVFPELLAAVAAGLNVLLVGPAGSGKTHVCSQVAKALAMDFGFTGAVMQEHKLLGFRTATGDIVRTEFRNRFEHGGLFLFDEIDGSSAQALIAFNAPLANGHGDFPDGVVAKHKDFRVIASANTFGTGANAMYCGRNQLDAATLDRFYVIPMGYDVAMESAVYGSGPISPVLLYKPNAGADVTGWAAYVQKMRSAMDRVGGVRHVISGRAIASGQKALLAGIPRDMVERAVIWKSLDAATIAKIKAVA